MTATSRIALFGEFRLVSQVAEQLAARGFNFVYLDGDPDNLASAGEHGYEVADVDYTDDDALADVGIGGGIDTIFCLFTDDSKNVFLTISARAIDPGLKIVSLAQSEGSEQKLLAAGANKVIDPYRLSGRRIYQLVTRPLVVDILDETVFGMQDLNLAEVPIPPGSVFDGRFLDEVGLERRYDLILLGVVDLEHGAELQFRTRRFNHRLDAGDILVVIGPADEIEALQKEIG